MNFKKLFTGVALAIFSYLLVICLLAAANSAIFTFVTSDREQVKNILSESGAYENAAPLLIKEFEKESKKSRGDVSLKNPEVKKIASETFDGQFIKGASENIIDELYGWLEGKTDRPHFKVELQPARKEFADKLGDYAIKRFDKLPPCQIGQLQADFNVLDTKCAPPGVTKKAIRSSINKSVAEDSQVISDQAVKTDNFKDEQGREVHESFENAPKVFQAAKLLPVFIMIIGLLAASGLIFLSGTRAKGFKRVGVSLAAAALLLLLIPVFLNGLAERTFAQSPDPWASEVLSPVIQGFNSATLPIYNWFGIGSLLAAITCLLIWWRLRQAELSK